MSIPLKERISIDNEGRQRTSFIIDANSPFQCNHHKRCPRLGVNIAFVKSKDCVFACVHVLCQYKNFSHIAAQNDQNLRMIFEKNL